MNPIVERELLLSRRRFFGASGLRMGGLALAMMAGKAAMAPAAVGAAESMHKALKGLPHFAP